MPHYYFDLKDGVTKRDHRGQELENDLQAIAQGKSLAEKMSAQPHEHMRHVSIIREDGHEVMKVHIAEAMSAPRLKKLP